MQRILIILKALWLDRFQHPGRGADGALDVLRCMSGGDKSSFELGWRQVNPRFEHAMKESGETGAIARHCVGEVVDRVLSEVPAEHRSNPFKLNGDSRFGRGLFHAGLELGAEL